VSPMIEHREPTADELPAADLAPAIYFEALAT
jgi:hypothetical protein